MGQHKGRNAQDNRTTTHAYPYKAKHGKTVRYKQKLD